MDEKPSKTISKERIILVSMAILLLGSLGFSGYSCAEVNRLQKKLASVYQYAPTHSAILDFQNSTGAVRIESTFTELIIASEGSTKKDDGYELALAILNPSSTSLTEISAHFSSEESKSATCESLEFRLLPGRSRVLKCFFADLAKEELSSVEVSVEFQKVAF